MFKYFFNQLDGYINEANKLSKSQKLKVNKIVSYAISCTETHMGRYGTDKYDRSSQMLSTTWLNAANELLEFENSKLERFARILKEKSSFWANPNAFDYSHPDAYDMMLVQVKAKLKELTL